jgi:hypothetical protein
MSFLQRLRHYKSLPFGLALWFALSVAASVAAPMVNGQQTIALCGAKGVVLLPVNAAAGSQDGSGDDASAGMHCPVCLSAGGGVPWLRTTADVPQASAIEVIFSTPPVCVEAGKGWPNSRGPPATGLAA